MKSVNDITWFDILLTRNIAMQIDKAIMFDYEIE